MQAQTAASRYTNRSIITGLGLVPCVLGIAGGYGLTFTGRVWLTDTSGLSPVVCVVTSAWIVLAISQSIREAASAYRVPMFRILSLTIYAIGVFIFVGWSALYSSLWLRATSIPTATAIVSDGIVHRVSDSFPAGSQSVWLMTGGSGKTFVHNVEGRVLAQSMEAQYKFDKPFIATRSHGEDLSAIVIETLNAILKPLTKQTRTQRVQLLTARGELEQISKMVCLAIMRGTGGCPLVLKLAPSSDSTVRSQVWSTEYTEAEAVAERHLPSLIQLLTHDALGPAELDTVFKQFSESALQSEQLGLVARKSRTIKEHQFAALIERILAAVDGGNEAGLVLLSTNRLNAEQRQALRGKVLREASAPFIAKHAVKLRLTDAEIAQMSPRLQSAAVRSGEVATSILDVFGERLPRDVQDSAVDAIEQAEAGLVIEALRTLNFSAAIRERLLKRLLSLTAASGKGFLNLSRDQLEASLAPKEFEALVAMLIPNTANSNTWLDFVVRTLPVHAMTPAQQKVVVDELMFNGTKTALEFVSVNHKHMERDIVNGVTRDYVRTIDRAFCLHLTHRNSTRRIDYFSQDQIRIFYDCAHAP